MNFKYFHLSPECWDYRHDASCPALEMNLTKEIQELYMKTTKQLGMMAHACIPPTLKSED
jgi:hypothetical protein